MKVTYNMYSFAISGMSREIMKMDDRDSAECQNWEMKGYNGHFGILFKSQNVKLVNSIISSNVKKKQKREFGEGLIQ